MNAPLTEQDFEHIENITYEGTDDEYGHRCFKAKRRN
jgi:hypothetical protein